MADLVGWEPRSGPTALLAALADQVPAGTTAKLAAVAAGEVPPGADPEGTARRILADREAGTPTPAWSCWALSTLMAALLDLGDHPAEVVGLRRIDGAAPPVDVHSVVVSTEAAGPVVCDPYFASVVAGPGRGGGEAVHRGVWARVVEEADSARWTYEVSRGRWANPLRYRSLAPTVDPGDVAALCAVSVTHTGVPPGPNASLRRTPVATDAFVHREGGAAVREWREGDPVDHERITEHPDWAAAAADMGARTGIALL